MPPRRATPTPAPRQDTGTTPPSQPGGGQEWSALHEAILGWYDTAARDLPWRAPGIGAWAVLVSEVMLQQTPVVRVEPIWREWMRRWPAPRDLAAAGTADVLAAWRGLGYPRRALRLRECALAIQRDHDGVVPSDEAELRALPGVGEYTAAAVRAFAFGERAVVLDTNVRRVLGRLVTGQALPSPTLTRPEREVAADLLPESARTSARWNVAVMELGALTCTARSPRCGQCPVADQCRWRAEGFPPDAHAARRRRQGWEGTDRQARGRVMAALRTETLVTREELAPLWPADPAQLDRALDSLVADGLATRTAEGFTLG